MSTKHFFSFILFFAFIFLSFPAFPKEDGIQDLCTSSTTIYAVEDGDWSSIEWRNLETDQVVAAPSDMAGSCVLIPTGVDVVRNGNLTFDDPFALKVSGTLTILGNLKLNAGSKDYLALQVNEGAQLIVDGELDAKNKVDLSFHSYVVVTGRVDMQGSQGELDIDGGARVYFLEGIQAAGNYGVLNCNDPSNYDPESNETCGHGDLSAFIENESGNPIFEDFISLATTYIENLTTDPADGVICPGGSATLTIKEIQATNIFWYKDAVKVESDGSRVKSVTAAGHYYAIYKVGSQWYHTNEINVDEDHEAPVAVCQNITISLDEDGQTVISPEQVDNGSTDNCGIASMTLSHDTFESANSYTKSIHSTDGYSVHLTISILSVVPQSQNCQWGYEYKLQYFYNISFSGDNVPSNLYTLQGSFVFADGHKMFFTLPNGESSGVELSSTHWSSRTDCATVTPADLGVDDVEIEIDGQGLTMTTVPLNYPPTTTLTVTDESGNSSSCTAMITIEENTAPIAICRDFTLNLNENGEGSISVEDINNGSYDQETSQTGLTYALDQYNFACSDIGENTVRLTVTDGGGRSSSCDALVTVEDNIAPIITTCPADSEFDCIEDLPLIQNITDFETLGGEVSDNCNPSNLTISYEDVTATASGCRIIRTYTITDKSENIAVCEQEFTIRDDIDPVLTCVDLTYVPANNDCSITISVEKPVINVDTDNCGFGDIEPVYSYHLASSPENEITGLGDIPETNFPLGRTTIHWTFADECGNSVSCTQFIDVTFELSEISYDDGSTSTDSGSGVYPMQTSIHTYSVDLKIPEDGYSYQWELFENNGGSLGDAVDPAHYIIDQTGEYNMASIAITFSEALPAETEYFIAVEKRRNGILCAKKEVLPIRIHPHDFDVELLPTGSDCQAGETGTPSTILWEISFPEIVTEPFQFDYNITLDGNPICTGTVSGIFYATANVTHDSGCAIGEPPVPPYALVSKNQDSKTVRLEYVISSVTGTDLQIGLTIEATDAFEVSDSDISNNSEDVILWGVPNTSDIETD